MDGLKELNIDNDTVTCFGPVEIKVAEAAGIFSFRVPTDAVQSFDVFDGHGLPSVIGKRIITDQIDILCLGPDEWVLRCVETEKSNLIERLSKQRSEIPFSLVDISDREVTLELKGRQAKDVLASGCPLDLSTIEVGGGKRTIFNGVQIVLYRNTEDDWCLDVWRSYASYLYRLLSKANIELQF